MAKKKPFSVPSNSLETRGLKVETTKEESKPVVRPKTEKKKEG